MSRQNGNRQNGNRKNDRKMWGAFLKEDSLLENDFSKDYYLKYTPFYRICELFSTGRKQSIAKINQSYTAARVLPRSSLPVWPSRAYSVSRKN